MALAQQLNDASRQVIARLKQANERMLSWDHCYGYFHRLPKTATREQIDHAALHLAFYLASYGMYRGSAALLAKDYKYLIPVVEKLRLKEFNTGRPSKLVADATSVEKAEAAWEQLQTLEAFLRHIGIDQFNLGILSTKILLGTWASVPAFDTSLKDALKTAEIGNATYSRKNFLRVFAYVNGAAPAFQQQVIRFHTAGFRHYPAIRVVDALLWHLGGGDGSESAAEKDEGAIKYVV